MKRLQAVAVFMVLAMATPALAGGKAKGPDPKVDVCHRKGKTGTFFVINVSVNALPAHLAHGDHQAGAFFLDADGDGFGAAGSTMDACQQTGYVGNNLDCDDSDAAIKPGAADALCDGVDDNCDGAADDQYAPLATSCGIGACAAGGVTSCVAGVVADSCAPGVPTSDANCDGVDNDCDASIDEEYLPTQTFCGVGVCAASGATSCVVGAVIDGCTAGQQLGQPEVQDLDRQRLLLHQQDVVGLEVPVDHPGLVSSLQGAADLLHHGEQGGSQRLLSGLAYLLEVVPQGAPREVLHHVVQPPLPGAPKIVDIDDVGVPDAHRGSGLHHKPIARLAARGTVQQLDGHLAPDLGMPAQVHRPVRTTPEDLLEDVIADVFAGQVRRGHRKMQYMEGG